MIIMEEDVNKVGNEEISEDVEVRVMVIQAEDQWNKVKRSSIKKIGLNFMPFRARARETYDRITIVLFDLGSTF